MPRLRPLPGQEPITLSASTIMTDAAVLSAAYSLLRLAGYPTGCMFRLSGTTVLNPRPLLPSRTMVNSLTHFPPSASEMFLRPITADEACRLLAGLSRTQWDHSGCRVEWQLGHQDETTSESLSQSTLDSPWFLPDEAIGFSS